MVLRVKAREAFWNLCPGCYFASMDSTSLYGGLLSLWNPKYASFQASSFVGIILEGFLRGSPLPITLVNCDGPYGERQDFWDKFQSSGLLGDHSLH